MCLDRDKAVQVSLSEDPFCIGNLKTQDLPSLSWSDEMMFMVSTPSPYTKESIRYFLLNTN